MKLPLALAFVLLLASPASAAPVQIPLSANEDQIGSQVTPFDEDPVAVSIATGSAIQAVDRGARGVDIVRRTATGPAVVLAHVADPAPEADRHLSVVAASASAWVAAITGGRSDGNRGEGGEDVEALDEVVVTGSLAGGPARQLVSCRTHGTPSLDAAIAGFDVAFSGADCAGSRGVWYVPSGAAPRPLAPRGDLRALGTTAALVADDDRDLLIGLAGGTTPVAGLSNAAFEDDGTLVTLLDGPPPTLARVGATVVPVGPAPDAAPPPGEGTVAGGGRALVANKLGNGVVAIDATSGAIGYAGGTRSAFPLAVDATRAAWLSEDCTGRPVAEIDATTPTRPGPPATQPCPLQLLSRAPAVRSGRVSLRVTCPAGCAASVLLRAGGHTIAAGAFTVAPGVTKTVRIALNHRGRALIARRRRVTARMVETSGWVYSQPPAIGVRLRRG